MSKSVVAYKVFNNKWQCRDFQFEVGKSYKHTGEVKLCQGGFHACSQLIDCFNYYSFDPDNKIAEVVLSGKIDHGNDNDKSDKVCGEKIKIVREISWNEALTMVNIGKANSGKGNTGHWNTGHRNTGHWNTGHWNTGHRNTGHWNTGDQNTGDRNTGHWNTGHWNTGHWNTGDRNTGHWNTGHWNTGHFNTVTPDTVLVFNKTCKRDRWEQAYVPSFLYFSLTQWVYEGEMTDQEKKENPTFFTTGGYLKHFTYKEAFQRAYNNASQSDKDAIKKLPNFNKKVFFDISGIEVV
ncbi:hypothetical protein LZD49_33570 [Dyadobacter sp. CY261]|uniref:pentapeptide repeat-containing protein n=1 Tax=Dyadobacter sp. CY261 TaxID=2907203 RepID=UPI001F3F641F|nr:hypothetical protein [Dyadobacter sp. CY261]MCF0075457.1 hypothetical protein [Dyadobacter sp. CY261]